MPASKQKYIIGERFWLLYSGLTKTNARKYAEVERKKGYRARVQKSGDTYTVWVSRKFASL